MKRVGLGDIILAFATIGLTSFGGGLSGWMYRVFVEQRKWLEEEDFLSILAMCQALPGINVVNLSIWIGFRLRGTVGALAGVCAIILPPLVVILFLASVYARWGHIAAVHRALAGVAAAAIALNLNMGVRASTVVIRRHLSAIAILLFLLLGVGIFELPMLPIVLVLAPLSVAVEFLRMRR